jgi:hypothetical protein
VIEVVFGENWVSIGLPSGHCQGESQHGFKWFSHTELSKDKILCDLAMIILKPAQVKWPRPQRSMRAIVNC